MIHLSSTSMKRIFMTGIAASAVILSGCAQMGSIPGMGGPGGSSQVADAGKVGGAIVISLISLTEALEQYNRAVGNAEKANEAKINAEGLKSGARKPDEVFTVVTDLSKSLNSKFEELSASGAKLSEASKEHLTKGIALHAVGTVAGIKAAKDLADAIKSRSPATLSALAGLAGFPPMLSTWGETTNAVIKFSQLQGVDASAKLSPSAMEKMGMGT